MRQEHEDRSYFLAFFTGGTLLRGSEGEGVLEQIDGVIEFGGHLYLVEMKW